MLGENEEGGASVNNSLTSLITPAHLLFIYLESDPQVSTHDEILHTWFTLCCASGFDRQATETTSFPQLYDFEQVDSVLLNTYIFNWIK